MNIYFINFFKKTTVFSVFLTVILFLGINFLPVLSIHYKHIFIVLFFYVSGLLFHFVLIRLTEKKVKSFTNYFMASTLIKLILYSAIILLYILNYKEDVKTFITVFFITYIVFTVLEVSSLQKFARNIK